MSTIYTATSLVERISKIISGDYITAAMEARIWLFMVDIFNQITDRDYNYQKVTSSMSVGSSVQTIDLPADFLRPITVYTLSSPGGSRIEVDRLSDGQWSYRTSTSNTAQYPSQYRIYGIDTDNNKQLEITPMFSSAATLYIDYYKIPDEPYEYKAGTGVATLDSPNVTGTSTQWSDFVSAKDYFRIDSVGKWYEISSITTDSNMVVSTYLTATKTDVAYTISNRIPLSNQGILALVYGVASQMLNINGEKEMAASYWQLHLDAMARYKGSEVKTTETAYNAYSRTYYNHHDYSDY